MFKTGIYSKQQNLIVVLLALILIVQVRNSFAPQQQQTLVSAETEDSTNGQDYSIFKSEGAQYPLTKDQQQQLHNLIKDYQILIIDNGNKFVLYDNGKPVHVFDRRDHPNCELFKRIDMDNE